MNSETHEAIIYGEKPTLFIDPVNDTAAVVDQGLFQGAPINEEEVNDLIRKMAEGDEAKRELAMLKPTLAYALYKLPKRQLRIRADEMEKLASSYAIQAKSDGQGGVILRSVKVL